MPATAERVSPLDAIQRALLLADFPRAEELAVKHLRRCPNDIAAAYMLGLTLARRGRLPEALPHLKRAADLNPPQRDCLIEYAQVLHDLGRGDEALLLFERAAHVDPSSALARERLAKCLLSAGRLAQAIGAAQQAVEIEPHRASSWSIIGSAWAGLGIADEAARAYGQAVRLAPNDADRAAAWAFLLNYIDASPADIAEAHRRFGEICTNRAPKLPAPRPRPDARQLRVGFLSPDLRDHPVARFIAPLLRHHDPKLTAIYLYSAHPAQDATSNALASLVKGWRCVAGLNDEALARAIRADGIDVLIDLAGLTGGTRVHAMAARIAPVQATYLGYPNTTGIPAIDARIVDAITDPPLAAPLGPEPLERIEGSMLCWEPPADAPPPSPPPFENNGFITFGSFNYPGKLTARCLSTWAALLAAIPNSRLLIKGKGLADEFSRRLFEKHTDRFQLPRDRVNLVPQTLDYTEHLASYAQIDIALDPMPYCGVTTTCEALWMGVPVISLRGNTHAARSGATILTAANLPGLIADLPESYISLAARLAADTQRLGGLRSQLRAHVASSPLTDGASFAPRFEKLIRSLHARGCRCPHPTTPAAS